MATSRARIESALQRAALHFAYPYGDRLAAGPREFALAKAAGFKTAVTTRPGMIFPENAEYPTALPRVSLNGNYQDERILPVLTSGAATAMWNGFRRVDAAYVVPVIASKAKQSKEQNWIASSLTLLPSTDDPAPAPRTSVKS